MGVRCLGEPWCTVPALNTLFGDTCSTTFKYLEIEYDCDRGKMPVWNVTWAQGPHLHERNALYYVL